MCGRLSSKSQREVIAKLYHATVTPGDHFPSFNVAPTQSAPIVRERADHERTVDMAKFGIPTGAPGRTFLLINLQSEKAGGRKDLRERRCVIPADGFYEWVQIGPKDKEPHYFYPPEGLFSFAGVWRQTADALCFSIFTTASADEGDEAPRTGGGRPVATFKQGGVEVSVWRNQTEKGDMFNTTIRNSYKDEASGEWKDTTSFSPTDLAVVSQLTSQAFQEIVQLRSQNRVR